MARRVIELKIFGRKRFSMDKIGGKDYKAAPVRISNDCDEDSQYSECFD